MGDDPVSCTSLANQSTSQRRRRSRRKSAITEVWNDDADSESAVDLSSDAQVDADASTCVGSGDSDEDVCSQRSRGSAVAAHQVSIIEPGEGAMPDGVFLGGSSDETSDGDQNATLAFLAAFRERRRA